MNSMVKKLLVYSLAGIMQVGFCATMVVASPLHNDGPEQFIQLDDRQNGGPGQQDQRKHQPQKPQREQPQPPDQPQETQPPEAGQDGPGGLGPNGQRQDQ